MFAPITRESRAQNAQCNSNLSSPPLRVRDVPFFMYVMYVAGYFEVLLETLKQKRTPRGSFETGLTTEKPGFKNCCELTRAGHSMETSSNAQILQSFKDFFDLQSTTPQQPCQCERCGSTMEYFNAHFWFYETEMAWNIPLPFCPSCDLDIVECGHSRQE
jgi:hypothetical protein